LSVAHFRFGAPENLFALLIIPLVVAYLAAMRRRRTRFTVTFTNFGVLKGVASTRRASWARRLPLIVLLLALALVAASLARPEVKLTSKKRSTSIVMLVDVSDSMRALDILPSRLQAAVNAMHAFVGELPASDKVGLVSFSDKVNVLAAPTTDHAAVASRLDVLTPQGGTALGDGVEGAVRLLVSSLAAQGVRHTPGHDLPAAIVLESDGKQNRGTASPFAAAQLARTAGIPIFGVALGTPGGVIHEGQGFFAIKIPVPPDLDVVSLLTRDSGGHAYTATTADQVNTIYRRLGTSLGTTPQLTEITSWFEAAAGVFLVAGVALARLRGPTLP
jgi:Ca-activated chloride channel homolog